MKKSIVVFVAICMSLLLITPSFAATSQTQDNHTETVLECVSTIDENEEVISLNNVEIIDSLDDVNIDGEAGHPISSLPKAASYVTPCSDKEWRYDFCRAILEILWKQSEFYSV